jgi:hypothetical protein
MNFGVHKICTCTLKFFIFEPISQYVTRCVTLQDKSPFLNDQSGLNFLNNFFN